MRVTEEKECRICGGELERVLDLGNIYPSTFLHDDEKVSEDEKAPLILDRCKECGLVQLEHTIDLDQMYRQYWYTSSLNKSMVSSLQDIVDYIEDYDYLDIDDVAVDIGCNDGTLLNLYGQEIYKIGFDPALNIKVPKCNIFFNDYFEASYLSKLGLKAKVVTAIAMFYDLPDPNKFVEDVKNILSTDGIFIIQFTDLLSMFKACAFDNICHEHLEYYRLEDVVKLLAVHGLDVIDVSYNDVNGGSIRVTSCISKAYPINSNVLEALEEEVKYFEQHSIKDFQKCIDTTKFKVTEFLKWAKDQALRVHVLGASTKGNTLLQVCGVKSDMVEFAAEVNKDKFGLRTVGSDIKIISEEESLIKHPDYYIVPVWHFKKSIYSNLKIYDYMLAGGKLIFPLPDFHVAFLDYNGQIKETRI